MAVTRHVAERSFRGYLDAQAVVAGELAVMRLSRNAEVEQLMQSLPARLATALLPKPRAG